MFQIMHISETPSLGQIDQLYLLARLRTEGAITDLEFQILKGKVMTHPGGHPELRRFTRASSTTASGAAGPFDQGTIHDTLESDGTEQGVNLNDAIQSGFRNYASFTGRAPRSEFWFWMLFVLVGSLAATVVDAVFGMAEIHADLYVPGPLFVVFMLATLSPTIAVTVRRMHDIERNGWWAWLYIVPVIGALVLWAFCAVKGTYGENEYGPDPLFPDHGSPIPEPLRLISMRPY